MLLVNYKPLATPLASLRLSSLTNLSDHLVIVNVRFLVV